MMQLMPIALVAWFPLAIYLFKKLTPRRALCITVVAAMMFLPMGELPLPKVPGRKDNLVCLGIGLATLLVDPTAFRRFKVKWFDIPVILLCINPLISATLNGLPPDEALGFALATFVGWALPYILGRVYLTDVRAVWYMAWCIFVGGLVYAPGCVFEMIMSPTLHRRVYGVDAFADFLQSVRMGGYRPVMFMQHGLMVGTFMCTAATFGIWLWWNGAMKSLSSVPKWVPVLFLLLVAVACKSAGAILLMLVGLGVLFGTRYMKKPWLVYVLVAVAPVYILARTVGGWTGENAVDLASSGLDKDHGGSLGVRFANENVLIARGMEKAVFGWGPNGGFLIRDSAGRVTSIPDGLWVIAFGSGGLVGLAAMFGMLLAPTIAFARRYPARTWAHPAMAAPAAIAVFLPTYAIDCLMNAMLNPAWIVALGGLGALACAANPMGAPPPGARGRLGRPRRAAAQQPPQQNVQVSIRDAETQTARP
jgi:hypothetical protein